MDLHLKGRRALVTGSTAGIGLAIAISLAPCPVGLGDSDLFARVTGLDYYAETSVGEFLLGSRRGD